MPNRVFSPGVTYSLTFSSFPSANDQENTSRSRKWQLRPKSTLSHSFPHGPTVSSPKLQTLPIEKIFSETKLVNRQYQRPVFTGRTVKWAMMTVKNGYENRRKLHTRTQDCIQRLAELSLRRCKSFRICILTSNLLVRILNRTIIWMITKRVKLSCMHAEQACPKSGETECAAQIHPTVSHRQTSSYRTLPLDYDEGSLLATW